MLAMREHVIFALGAALAGDAVHAGEEIDVLFDREVVIEGELLRHVADVAADLFGLGGDVEAVHAGACPKWA